MINCKEMAKKIKADIKQKVDGKDISLAIIQVGDNPASNRYVNGKLKDCKEVGINPLLIKFDETTDQEDVIDKILELNEDNNVHGVIVQLPLPKHMDEEYVTDMVDLWKDVDGFKYNSPFTPCTPKGVLTILDELNVDLTGKIVCLVGYGKLVNRPLMNLLSDKGATMIVCRSKTPKHLLKHYCLESDIIITATGRHGIITEDMVSGIDQVIIDCGIQVINVKQYGDCDESVYKATNLVTPRIKGVGLLTRCSLIQNVVDAYFVKQNVK